MASLATIKKYFIATILFCLALPHTYGASPLDHSDLFLTPLIRAGELSKAKELSADHMKQFHIKSSTNEKLTSYSGYLTVDEASNSNLFFWFFPALESPETAPVIMSMNEVAGFSCLKEVFLQNGPFYVDDNLELRDRNLTWVQKYSMLYLDAPVGTGFSFTERPEGYAKNSDDEAEEVVAGLQQFFALFQEFSERDFYLNGRSVSAIHIPSMIHHIEANNKDGSKIIINVKGAILESPFFNVPFHLGYAEAYHAVGLIDDNQRKEMEEQVQRIKAKMAEKKFHEAHLELFKIILTPEGMYARMTGFTSHASFLNATEAPELTNFLRFVREEEVHNYLHVGLHKFQLINVDVLGRFRAEIMEADGTAVQSIMPKYKVLITAGQFDPVVLHQGVTRAVNELSWASDNGGFKGAERKIWRVNGDVAGYVRRAGKAVYALLRSYGRYTAQDKPEWMLQLVQNFIENKPF